MGVVTASALPSDPLEALHELTAGEAEIDRLRRHLARVARSAGFTWDQIGEALGMTRQSAWEYFSRDTRDVITRTAVDNEQLGEGDAERLAVEEVRAVRRQRRNR